MIALLIALQMTTCMPTANGGQTCMTTPPVAQTDSGPSLADIIMAARERHERSAVGKMLVSGDCAGAERYALTKGRFDLVATVRDYCARSVPAAATPVAPQPTAPRKLSANTASGYCLDVPPDYVGTGAANSPAVSSGMPPCGRE